MCNGQEFGLAPGDTKRRWMQRKEVQETNSFKNKKLMRPDGWVIKKYLSEESNPDRWRKISRNTDNNAIKIFKNKCFSSTENANGGDSSTSWKVNNTSTAKKWTVVDSKFKIKNKHKEFIKTTSTIQCDEEKGDKSVIIVDEKLNTAVQRFENVEITPLSLDTFENFVKKQEDLKDADQKLTLRKKEEFSNSNISVVSIENKKIREMTESKEEKKTEYENRKEISFVKNPSSIAEENNIKKNNAVNKFYHITGVVRFITIFYLVKCC